MSALLYKKFLSGLLAAAFTIGAGLAVLPAAGAYAQDSVSAVGEEFSYDFKSGGSGYVTEMIERKYGEGYAALYHDMVDRLAEATVSDVEFSRSVDITYNVGDDILPSGADNVILMELATLIMYDEPQLYWVDGFGISYSSKIFILRFITDERYRSASARAEANSTLVAALGEYHELIASKKGAFFKLAALNDMLADKTKYDLSQVNEDRYNVMGCLRDHLCVCDGYAKAFELIANVEGLGDTVRVFNGSHAWNAVNFNDSWYFIDVTFNDVIVDSVDCPNSEYWRRYFLKSIYDSSFQDGRHDSMDLLYSLYEVPETALESFVYTEAVSINTPAGFEKGTLSYDRRRAGSYFGSSESKTLDNWTLNFSDVNDGTYQMTFYSENAAAMDIEFEVKGGAPTEPLDLKLNAMGDVNGDGRVNATDLLMTKAMIKGVAELDEYSRKCADINGDGNVKAADLLRMKAHIKGVSSIWS